ncbi:MAG: radical SAM protein [Oligoflexia bacterium]|nr:radical SAM protein [Oligoflexia bacterium]
MSEEKKDRNHIYFKSTTSMCNKCEALVNTKVLFRGEKVIFRKFCPDCGITENMVSSDSKHYLNAYHFNKPGTIPHHVNSKREQGCPNDCGLCEEHEQHTCQPVIDISDRCNMNCPICITGGNQSSFSFTTEDFKKILDNLIRAEGKLPVIILAGGEPTIHPQVFDFIKMAYDSGKVERVGLNTNGIKIAEDKEFAKKIKESGAYLFFQFDGWDESTYVKLRGKNYLPQKLAAIEAIEREEIPAIINATVVKGINDHQIGKIVTFISSHKNFLGVTFQPAAYVGSGKSFEVDPMDVMTIPCVEKAIIEQSNDILKQGDFANLPCSHPLCFSLAYLFKYTDEDGTIKAVPFSRFLEIKDILDLAQNKGIVSISDKNIERTYEKMVYNLWSGDANIPCSDKICSNLKDLFSKIFPTDKKISEKEKINLGDFSAKTVFIHHYMDRYTFDLERVQKCCNHYPKSDGRLMPMCVYNNFYRQFPEGKRTKKVVCKK